MSTCEKSKYCCIGKCVTDFLKRETYQLNRTAKICVISDKVRWCLENVLNSKGAVESELCVSQQFEKESLSLTTSTKKAPKFSVKTNRLQKYCDFKIDLQDPTLKFDFCFDKKKGFAVCANTTYDWSNQNCDGEVAFCYSGLDRILIGAKVNIDRKKDKPLSVSNYNIGFQFCQNADRTFALTTKDSLSKISAGSDFAVRDGYRGYAQVTYDTALQENNMSFAFGVNRTISDNSSISGVYYSDQTASFLYANNFTKNNICTKLGCNFDFKQNPADRARIEWKIVFGECCKPTQCATKPSCN